MRKRPSCRQDGERAVLSENATRTNRHSQVDGLPKEWEIKNRRSEELIKLATSVLSGGAEGGLGASRDDGGPV
jgi:hypothetical protein